MTDMNVWDMYHHRIENHGGSKRGAIIKNEIRAINHKLPDNPSYTCVTIYDQEHGYNQTTEAICLSGKNNMRSGYRQDVAIINSDNLNEKTLITMPGEDIQQGDLVHWMDNYWLVTERDANTTLYTKVKLLQCNYLLRWVDNNKNIYEQWCVVEDGTKYLTGELEDTRKYITTKVDSRIAVTLARNDATKMLTREQRFLIDDYESPEMLAYILSKPLKTGLSYSSHGIYKFVLQEVTNTIDDNFEIRVADYYKYFPKAEDVLEDDSSDEMSGERRKWL